MSKEQTPIEWLKQKLWQRGAIEKKDFELLNEAMKKQEEQTKAKVLEALERDMSKEQLEELCYQLYMVGSTDSLKGIIRGRDQVMVIFNERLKTLTKNQNKDEKKNS
jgi:hypothetical protein